MTFLTKLKKIIKNYKKMKTPKKGDLVKVTGNSNSNNYEIGKVYRVKTVKNSDKTLTADSLDGSWTGNNLSFLDFEITGLNREHFESDIKELELQIAETRSVIQWMDEAGVTEYDENEHRVWKALTAMEDSKMSKIDRMKAIAALLK